MKAKTVCERAINTALYKYGIVQYRDGNTGSGPSWEYNVMLWKNNAWHCDCLGFVHCIVNGFVGNKAVLGGGAVMDDFVLCSDEATTLNKYCSKKGKFPKKDLKAGALLQESGHVGLYVGEYKVKRSNGTTDIYNTAECTMACGGGAMLTWTDLSTGKRYNKKGGYQLSAWSNWGYFDRVDYTAEKEDKKDNIKPNKILEIVKDTIDGKYGVQPEREKKITAEFGSTVYRKVQDIINILYR